MKSDWTYATFQKSFNQQSLGDWRLAVSLETGSTMDDARALLTSGDCQSTCVISRQQQGGRGQQGRVWQSNPGGFYATYVFKVEQGRALTGFSLVTGVIIAQLLSDFGADIRLKWPNDLLSQTGKKLGGILTEVVPIATGQALLIGIGINFSNPIDEKTATSLKSLGAEALEIPQAAAMLGEALERALAVFNAHGLPSFLEAWKARDYLIGRSIRMHVAGDELQGKVVGINSGGALLMQLSDSLREVWSGHILEIAPKTESH